MAVDKAPPENAELAKLASLLQEASSLSVASRELLISALQDGLEPDEDWDDEYIAALGREADAIDAGAPTYSLEEVVASLRVPR